MNREPIRSPARSVANVEFHHAGDHVNDVAHKIVTVLETQGIRAINPAMGFPMEMDRFTIGWSMKGESLVAAHGPPDCEAVQSPGDVTTRFGPTLKTGRRAATQDLSQSWSRRCWLR